MGGLRLGRALWSRAHKALLGCKNLLLTLCHVTIVHTYRLYIIVLSFWSDFLLMSLAGLPQSSPPKSLLVVLTCIIKQQRTELERHWLAHFPPLCSSREFSVSACESERESRPNRGYRVHGDSSNSVTGHLIITWSWRRQRKGTKILLFQKLSPLAKRFVLGCGYNSHNKLCLLRHMRSSPGPQNKRQNLQCSCVVCWREHCAGNGWCCSPWL